MTSRYNKFFPFSDKVIDQAKFMFYMKIEIEIIILFI